MTDTTIITIPVESFRGPNYEEGKHPEECFACGKKMSTKAMADPWMVHCANGGLDIMPTDWEATTDDEISGDLLWFAIGPECAKALPTTHRRKF